MQYINGKKRMEIISNYVARNYDCAIRLANEYLTEYKDDTYVLLYIGLCYRCKKEYDKAIEICKYVLTLESDNITAKEDLFDLYFRMGDYESAKPLLDELLENVNEEYDTNEYYEYAREIIDNYFIEKHTKENA